MQQTGNTCAEKQSAPDYSAAPSLLDYLEILAKRWKLIVSITIVVTLLTVIYSLTLPNVYTAKAKILPPQGGGGLLSAAMMQGALQAAIGGADILGESKSTKLYTELLKIESLRDPIIEKFKLKDVYNAKFRSDVYQQLNKNVTIQGSKEGIISISVDDKDPKRAAEMANAFIEELKKLSTSMSITGATNTKAFLEERLAKTQEELTQAGNNLKAFQQKHKTLDVTQQAAASSQMMVQLSAQLAAQEVQLGVARRTYSDTSQEVKNIQQSIGGLRGKIAQLQGGSGTGSFAGIGQITEKGHEYLQLLRKFKTAEAVYEMLIKQYEVARLNAENDVSTIQVIQKPLVPEMKSKPVRRKMVQVALLISLIGSIALAFGLENMGQMDEDTRKRLQRMKGMLRLRSGNLTT